MRCREMSYRSFFRFRQPLRQQLFHASCWSCSSRDEPFRTVTVRPRSGTQNSAGSTKTKKYSSWTMSRSTAREAPNVEANFSFEITSVSGRALEAERHFLVIEVNFDMFVVMLEVNPMNFNTSSRVERSISEGSQLRNHCEWTKLLIYKIEKLN